MGIARRLTDAAGRRRTALALSGVIALAGGACIGLALLSQQHRHEPPLTIGVPTQSQLRPGATGAAVVRPMSPASRPTSLSIPAIGVHSAIVSLGLLPDGSMQVPVPGPHYNEAGWYRYSPTPGSLGPAVIVGHVDSAADGPSVFYRLGSLNPRDLVEVSRGDGSVAVFAVDSVSRYHKSAFPSRLVYGDTDNAALRLITCGGAFDSATGHYLDNVVVMASLVRSQPRASAATTSRVG